MINVKSIIQYFFISKVIDTIFLLYIITQFIIKGVKIICTKISLLPNILVKKLKQPIIQRAAKRV